MISLPLIFRTTTVSGIGMKSVGQPRLCQRRLGVFDRGVLDEGRIVRLAPDAVIDGGDLDRSDLVFVEADGRLDRRIGEGGEDEFQLSARPKAAARRQIQATCDVSC